MRTGTRSRLARLGSRLGFVKSGTLLRPAQAVMTVQRSSWPVVIAAALLPLSTTSAEEWSRSNDKPQAPHSSADPKARADRDRILALPEQDRALIVTGLAALAEKELSQRHRSEEESQYFRVITDLQGKSTAHDLLDNLDASFTSIHRILDKELPLSGTGPKIVTYVFARAESYQRLMARAGSVGWSAGFYHPAGFMAFHAQCPSRGYLMATLIHESSHALFDQYLRRPGVELPRWLEEGLAEYMGHSDMVDGELRPGDHRQRWSGWSYWNAARSFVLINSAARTDAIRVRRAISDRKALTLATIMTAGSDQFYGEQRGLYYCQAWLTVHFLRHGRPSWERREFPQFVRRVAAGSDPLRTFVEEYGVEPSALEEQFREYVKRF